MIKKIIDWFFDPIKKQITKIKKDIIINYAFFFIVIFILIMIFKFRG